MEISLEKLIRVVTAEVVKELKRQGVTVVASSGQNTSIRHHVDERTRSEEIDMSKYNTPVLTENHIRRLHALTGEIIVPKGTIVSPKARELIRERQLTVTIKPSGLE